MRHVSLRLLFYYLYHQPVPVRRRKPKDTRWSVSTQHSTKPFDFFLCLLPLGIRLRFPSRFHIHTEERTVNVSTTPGNGSRSGGHIFNIRPLLSGKDRNGHDHCEADIAIQKPYFDLEGSAALPLFVILASLSAYCSVGVLIGAPAMPYTLGTVA